MNKYLLKTAAVIFLILMSSFIVYGVYTDCPDTAGYVRCGGVTL